MRWSYAAAAAGRESNWVGDLFEHFTWSHAATLIAACIAAIVTVTGVLIGIAATAGASRRERRADVYAEALRAVADYLEGPYRVRRKDGSAQSRASISATLNDVKTRIDYSQARLQLHAPADVGTTYDDYVEAALSEAGSQMKAAWLLPPIKKNAQMNLGKPYPRVVSDPRRGLVLDAMRRDLNRRWWRL